MGKHLIRRCFIAGLVVWLPIWVTFVIVRFVIDLLDSTLSLLPHSYQPEQLFGRNIPGLGLIVTILIIFLTGLLATNFIGNRLISFWERVLARIPLVRTIYTAAKQVTDAFIQPKGKSFRKVLLVQYPRQGVWSLAFQTASQVSMPLEKGMIAAFIPTTPNPTSGFLIFAPKADTIELDITVEEAFKMIISLGVVMPVEKTLPTPPA